MFAGELADRKAVLEQTLYKLNEFIDGIEHPEVRQNLQGAVERERELLFRREKKEMERQQARVAIGAIDGELADLRRELKHKGQGKKQELLTGMKRKRWYFFKNYPLWVFDRNTGLLWPNLDYVELFFGPRVEVAKQVELHELGNWSVPTYQDLKTAWEDRSFPFLNVNYQVVCRKKWQEEQRFQTEEGFILSSDFSYNTGDYSSYALYPCNRKYATDEFQPGRHNRLYPDGLESERRLLQFFLDEHLMPFFEDEGQQEIFHKIVRRRELMKQYGKLLGEGIGSDMVYALPELLTRCREDALQYTQSVTTLQFYQVAHQWLSKFTTALEDYGSTHRRDMEVLERIKETINRPDLERIEESQRDSALLRRFCLNKVAKVSLAELQQQIKIISEDVEKIGRDFQEVLTATGSLDRLAALENSRRPSLNFLLQFVCQEIQTALAGLEWQEKHVAVMEIVAQCQTKLYEYYTEVLPEGAQSLAEQCAEHSLDPELAAGWHERWLQEIKMVDGRVLPLFHAVQEGIIPDATAVFLGQKLLQYADQVRRFYLEYRTELYSKYQDDPEGDGKREAEQLLKLTGQLVAAVKSASFDLERVAAKNFLRQWSHPWLQTRSL